MSVTSAPPALSQAGEAAISVDADTDTEVSSLRLSSAPPSSSLRASPFTLPRVLRPPSSLGLFPPLSSLSHRAAATGRLTPTTPILPVPRSTTALFQCIQQTHKPKSIFIVGGTRQRTVDRTNTLIEEDSNQQTTHIGTHQLTVQTAIVNTDSAVTRTDEPQLESNQHIQTNAAEQTSALETEIATVPVDIDVSRHTPAEQQVVSVTAPVESLETPVLSLEMPALDRASPMPPFQQMQQDWRQEHIQKKRKAVVSLSDHSARLFSQPEAEVRTAHTWQPVEEQTQAAMALTPETQLSSIPSLIIEQPESQAIVELPQSQEPPHDTATQMPLLTEPTQEGATENTTTCAAEDVDLLGEHEQHAQAERQVSALVVSQAAQGWSVADLFSSSPLPEHEESVVYPWYESADGVTAGETAQLAALFAKRDEMDDVDDDDIEEFTNTAEQQQRTELMKQKRAENKHRGRKKARVLQPHKKTAPQIIPAPAANVSATILADGGLPVPSGIALQTDTHIRSASSSIVVSPPSLPSLGYQESILYRALDQFHPPIAAANTIIDSATIRSTVSEATAAHSQAPTAATLNGQDDQPARPTAQQQAVAEPTITARSKKIVSVYERSLPQTIVLTLPSHLDGDTVLATTTLSQAQREKTTDLPLQQELERLQVLTETLQCALNSSGDQMSAKDALIVDLQQKLMEATQAQAQAEQTRRLMNVDNDLMCSLANELIKVVEKYAPNVNQHAQRNGYW